MLSVSFNPRANETHTIGHSSRFLGNSIFKSSTRSSIGSCHSELKLLSNAATNPRKIGANFSAEVTGITGILIHNAHC